MQFFIISPSAISRRRRLVFGLYVCMCVRDHIRKACKYDILQTA